MTWPIAEQTNSNKSNTIIVVFVSQLKILKILIIYADKVSSMIALESVALADYNAVRMRSTVYDNWPLRGFHICEQISIDR